MKMKRVLSLLLALVMAFSLLTLPSYAEDEDSAEDVTPVAFSTLTVAEQYDALMAMEESDAEAVFYALTAEQQTALQDYAMEQAIANYVAPETVVFTDAGPFMPAVNVAPARKLMKSASAPKMLLGAPTLPDAKGLEFTKTAKDNGGGTYTITMEAYTTGSVSTETSTTPVDFVLVLDQSASMTRSLGDVTRQAAMKSAVSNFIDQVGKKYDAEKSDHRMALVTFGDGATTLKGWTNVDGYVEGQVGTKGVKSLKEAINSLPDYWTNVGTPTDEGMAQANKLINGSDYKYEGKNTNRQKVVILFTDGVPGTGDFNISVANDALKSANAMKAAGVAVYTVGIFNGANPNELYGASGFDTNSNGSVNSQWIEDNWGLFPGNDFAKADGVAGNRLLNYLSSNFTGVTEIGLTRRTSGLGILHSKITYTITKNYTRTASKYYLTADSADALNELFTTIYERIDTRDIDLGSKTVVRDTVSDYFKAPANANAVTVKTYDCNGFDGNGKPLFAQNGTTFTEMPTVENGVVSVKGFDFNENFVAKNPDGSPHGKKLVIEFTVSPKDGFLGGNNVPTNGEASVVDENGTVVEGQPSPVVDIPIDPVTVTAADKNVYLTNSLTEEDLLKGVIIKCGDVDITDPSKLQPWQIAYVSIDKDATTGLTNLKKDTTYTVTATVAPKDETGTATAQPGNDTANVYVFKPEVTFKDSTVYYGDDAPENPTGYNDSNLVKPIKWMHNGAEAVPANMTGTAPVLTWTYTPGDGVEDSIIKTTEDIPVSAVAKITMAAGTSEDITKYVTFKHQDCNPACGWNETELNGDPAFLLHVKTCTLTVKKVINQGDVDDYQSFIFNVKTEGNIPQSMKVTVQMGENDDSVTIVGLPTGTYTVKEDDGWSWRYDFVSATNNGVANLDSTNLTATVTVTNKRANDKWLSGENYAINHVGGIKASGTFVSGN